MGAKEEGMPNPLFRLMDRLDALNTKIDRKLGTRYRTKYHGVPQHSFDSKEKAAVGAQMWAEAHPDDPFTEIELLVNGRWEGAGSALRSSSDGKIHVYMYR
jgi:hypothetical protein